MSHNAVTQGERSMLSKEAVEKHIAGTVEFVKLGEFLEGRPESCVDGRGKNGIIGTPGGNMGEFILAMTAAERISGQKIDESRMTEILTRYCEVFGKFHMHTDCHALDSLKCAGHLFQTDEAEEILRRPGEEIREELLCALIKPENVGCKHLQLMLTKSEDYGVRPELVEAAIRSFFELLWNGADMDLEILEGDHKEGAVVNFVHEVEDLSKETLIPTIVPEANGEQMFVNHPPATRFMRVYEVENMGRIVGIKIDPSLYVQEVETLGLRHLQNTLSHIAEGLPIFQATFKADGTFDVTQL